MDEYNEMRKEALRLEAENVQLREQVRVLELDALDRDEVNRGLREQLAACLEKVAQLTDDNTGWSLKLAETEAKVEKWIAWADKVEKGVIEALK